MPVRTRCPSCDAEFTLEDRLRGKRVRCKSCQEEFVVEEADGAGAKSSSRDGIQSKPNPAGPPPRRRVVDDDDEPRSRRRDPDDDDARRPRRRPRDDEDDFQSRRHQGSGATLVWIAIPFVLIVAIGVIGLGAYFIVRSRDVAEVQEAQVVGGAVNPLQGGAMVKKADVVQAAGTSVPLQIKDTDLRDVIINGPANTRAAVHFWDNNGGNLKKMFAVFDLAKRAELCRFEHLDAEQMDLSADGSRLVVFTNRVDGGKLLRELTVFGLPDGKPIVQSWAPYPEEADFRKRRQLAWAYLLSDKELLTVTREGQLDRWRLPGKERLSTTPPTVESLNLNVNGSAHTPNHFAISPDRKTLAVFNKDGFNLFDTANGKLAGKTAILSDQGTLLNFWGVAFSPDSKNLVCHYFMNFKGDRNQHVGALARWSIPDGQRISVVNIAADISVSGGMACWGPNHVVLWDGNLFGGKVYDLAKGQFCREIKQKFGKCISQSQDGKVWFATADFDLGLATLSSVDFPQQDLTQFPPRPNDNRRWKLTPAGIAAGL